MTDKAGAPTVSQARIPELDGIRGLAILLIMVLHAFFAMPDRSPLFERAARVFDYAWSGVDLFFVLSGFLIGGIILDVQGKRRWAAAFYARRFFRIFPLYYAWLIVVGLAIFLLERTGAAESWRTLFTPEIPTWMFPAYLQNFWMALHKKFITPVLNPTWSLAIEEQFYFVLPATIYLVPRRWLPWVMGALIALAFALRTYFYYAHNAIAPYVLLPCRADTFAIGVLLAMLFRAPAWFDWTKQHLQLVRGAFALAGLAVAFMIWRNSTHWDLMFGYSSLAVFYGLMVLLTLASDGVLRRAFRAGWLQHMGRRAYGLYMFHAALIWILHRAIRGATPAATDALSLGVTMLALGVAFVAAEATWRWMEKPLIDFAQARFRYVAAP